MKIFHVLHGFSPELTGGTERVVEALARAMIAQGHEVSVVCGSLEVANTDRVDELDHDGIRVLRLHRDDLYFESWFKTYHPGVSRTLLRLFQEERPDVVHVHHWLRLTSDIARLARSTGARVVVTAHDYFTVLARVVRRAGDDLIVVPDPAEWMSDLEAEEEFELHRRDFFDELSAADVRMAPSAAHAAGLLELAPGEFGEIVVSPPPLLSVPSRLVREPVRGGNLLVTWGSIYPDKGLEIVMDAMRAAGGDWKLQILGVAHDPEYEAEIRNFSTGIDVTFSGAFDDSDLPKIEADYAVLPSICEESYGLVMDEAQALGLPVIASDLQAYREHCQESSCAFFEAGDTAELTMMLLDRDGLAKLDRPSAPDLRSTEAAADQVLGHYAAGTSPSAWSPDDALERDRARMLFRRAERRLHAVLDRGGTAPPDEFLA
jgi:glycogen(starch) synthase